ncbi:hypothetical protein L3C06_09275 [Lacticaseibacillus paracasei subsp. paracasei]|uniref:hypothetical protein n=1 Tax=Lacticaseibacillus paracasei TaxID=1597 RepID=UPI001F319DEE|nr:hypothetical protein [Lacticaseibacillus paracasei]UJS06803.1 hypothetical protein L3C06_09275 [Lacticaseibacillus paracasei subsp. paracasei]
MKAKQEKQSLSQVCLNLKILKAEKLASYCEKLIEQHKNGTYDDAISDLEKQRRDHRYRNGSDDDQAFQQAIDRIIKVALSQRIAN